MTYATSFPDFDPASMPAIPAGFEDRSWRNDTMPTFRDDARNLSLWIDYADPAQREFADGKRFTLVRDGNLDPYEDETLCESDDYAEILAILESL